MNVHRGRGDDGASLILALAFLSLLGVFVASVLAFGAVSFENTTVTRSRAKQLYAADGGVEQAIQRVAREEWCMTADAPSQVTLPEPINGKSVTVTCETTDGGLTTNSGSPLLGDFVAVIGSGGVSVNGGGWGPAEIHGSMRSGGPMSIQWSDPQGICAAGFAPWVFASFGLTQHDPLICAWIDVGGSLSVTGCPPAKVYVTGPCIPAPPPVPVPTVRIPSTNAHSAVDLRTLPPPYNLDCIIMYPGKYPNRPTFDPNRRYYLASGTYYFANPSSSGGDVVLQGQIVGGMPSPAEPWGDTPQVNGLQPCASFPGLTPDQVADEASVLGTGPAYDAATAGTGVTLVRGNSAKLRVASANTKVELYTRVPGSADPNATPGVTFWANTGTSGTSLQSSSAPYVPVPNNCGAPGCEVFVSTDNQVDVVIHGLSYLPNSRTNLTEPFNHEVGSGNGSVSFFLGGVAAKTLTITRHYDNDIRRVSLAGTGEPTESFANRTTTVTATAESTSGGAPTTVTAVVRPDEPTPQILSWRQS